MSADDQVDVANEPHTAKTALSRSPALAVLAGIVFIVGLFGIVANIVLIARRVFSATDVPWRDVPWRFQIWEYQLRATAILACVALLVAAARIAKQRMKSGIFLIIAAFAVAIANSVANPGLQHYFAGDTYVVERPDGSTAVVIIGSPDESMQGPGGRSRSNGIAGASANLAASGAGGITNSVGMKLVLVPAGSFDLGRSESLRELEDRFPIIAINAKNPDFRKTIESEQPRRRVRITRPFYLGKYNVTLAQFQRFVDDTGYRTDAEKDGQGASGYVTGEPASFAVRKEFSWRKTGFPQQSDSPVVEITWNDAVAFCEWLSKHEGKKYRLPTNAEWEYACRAGTTTLYSSGDSPDELVKVANVADKAYFSLLLGKNPPAGSVARVIAMGMMVNADDGYAFTSPVGRFQPNAFGLFDMHGNASTWCMDWYAPDYYENSSTVDPQGPGMGTNRVVRGGNWQFYPAFCRSASRFNYAPSRREPFLGMRVVCELSRE